MRPKAPLSKSAQAWPAAQAVRPCVAKGKPRAMSQATLVEGIAKSIKEEIPEVREVIDVTDHASGDNPFY